VGVTEVTFYVDSTPYTGTFNTGTWSSAPITGFTSGAYAITAQAKDAAGNTTTSSSFSLTIDTTAPAAPTAPDLADASDSGVNTDNTTNITPVTFTGTAEAGSTVSLYAQTACGGSVVATTTGGSYTFTGVALTANATTTFSAKATDAAGNASPCSSDLAVTHDTIAPTITTLTAPANATYGSGQNLNFVATMSEATTVTGTPRIALTIGVTTRYATYLSGSGTTSLTFRYTTQSGDNDTDGIAVTSPVQLNSGTLADATGNAATLTFTPPNTTLVRVDTTAPTLSSLLITSPSAGNYPSGQSITATATFSESVSGATLSLPFLVNGTPTAAQTCSGSGSTRTCNYTTTSTAGPITIAANALTATGTMVDGGGNAVASLNHAAVTLPSINANVPIDCSNPTVLASATPGNVCSDGSIYAGSSPDGTKAMFTTTAANENSGTQWNDGTGNWRDTSLANCSSGSESICRTGKSNSSTLATEDSSSATGIQPHNAAQYCENLTAHGQTDWYLPARSELNVLYTNRTAIGGFSGAWYWSSSEVSSPHAWGQPFTTGAPGWVGKSISGRVRCVRRVN
jgi:hypothetical protein